MVQGTHGLARLLEGEPVTVIAPPASLIKTIVSVSSLIPRTTHHSIDDIYDTHDRGGETIKPRIRIMASVTTHPRPQTATALVVLV